MSQGFMSFVGFLKVFFEKAIDIIFECCIPAIQYTVRHSIGDFGASYDPERFEGSCAYKLESINQLFEKLSPD